MISKRQYGLAAQRRGAAAVLVGITLPILVGFAALTIDVGVMYNARVELQNAADAGSLAAVAKLNEPGLADPLGEARAAAAAVVALNSSLGKGLAIDSFSDVQFGQVEIDPDSGRYSFSNNDIRPNAVRVTVRMTDDSPNGSVPLFFAPIFGKTRTNISASGAAVIGGQRDIAIVIDLSGSMNDDSNLRYFDRTLVNTRDVWASLDGPLPSVPYIPGSEGETEYATDTGPAIGVMDTWGTSLSDTNYNPTTDPGLWYIPSGTTTEPAVRTSLTSRGYSNAQIDAVMAGSSAWRNRAAVMTGLAEWAPAGVTDTSVDSDELTWAPYPPFRKSWTWENYLDWGTRSFNRLTREHSAFRYRYGPKTFTSYVLNEVYSHDETDLTHTPEEPLHSVKDGLQAMIPLTTSFDQLSLEVFGTTARHEMDLTNNRQAVADRLYRLQANHYDQTTNIGGGLERAIEELTSPRAREDALKVIVLMSDGRSNTGPDPRSVAEDAANLGFKVYTISVGFGVDRELMRDIASITGGEEFFAAGEPEQYTRQLIDIFRTIGGLGTPVLVE